ncbi:hypothetical protein [Aeromicrobium sp. UC242_57]|uniref:hypothetical protein n=1 Tax=Aeromicrobium sp. UC242_57 TaxID=3374624 RepID=UPI0037BE8126
MGRLVALAVPLLIIAVIALGGNASWQRGDLNRFICDGDCGPAYVVAPDGCRSTRRRRKPRGPRRHSARSIPPSCQRPSRPA